MNTFGSIPQFKSKQMCTYNNPPSYKSIPFCNKNKSGRRFNILLSVNMCLKCALIRRVTFGVSGLIREVLLYCDWWGINCRGIL